MAQRLENFDIRRIKQRPIDFTKYLKRTDQLFRKRYITKPITAGVLKALKTVSGIDTKTERPWFMVATPGGNLDPFYKSAIAVWNRLVQGQRKQAAWKLEGIAYLSNGKAIEFYPEPLKTNRFFDLTSAGLSRAIGKTKAAKKVYSTPFMYDLYSRYIHGGLASALGNEGLVSQSSVRRISTKPYNKGKPEREWDTFATDGTKMRWPGIGKKPVVITRIRYTFRPSVA
jgi:hypothetical protein